jgi:starch synthase
MACAGTVIASRVGGLAEIVEDGESGILVEPNNPGQLARAVVGLINDPERCRQIGLAARPRIVQKFSSPVVAARMGSFYEEVVAEAAQ